MDKKDTPKTSADRTAGESDVFAQGYTESVRRLHLIVPLALLIPMLALVPIGGMEASSAAAADSRLVGAYLSGLLLAIPCGLIYLAESRISRFPLFLLTCLLLMAGSLTVSYYWGKATGLSAQGTDLAADVVILLLIFLDAMSMRYNENSRIRSKREADLSWTGDSRFLPGPGWAVFVCFAGVYAISLIVHSAGLGNAALAGGILYFFLFCPWLLLRGRAKYLENRKHVRGVPAQRIRKLHNRLIPAILLPASVLAAVSMLTAGGRQFINLPSFQIPVDESRIQESFMQQQFMMEELMQMAGAEEGAAPPQWVVRLLLFIENAVTVICIVLFIWFLVHLILYAAKKFSGIEKEEKKTHFAEGIDEHFRIRTPSMRPFTSLSGVRRRYRRLILTYRKQAPGISETPSEMEELAHIPESEDIHSLHDEYERVRYGRG